MKEFLKKFLNEEQMTVVEEAYKAANPDSKGLPVYISKSRLDEVLGKQHGAETERDNLSKQLEELQKGTQNQIDEAVKAAVEKASGEQKKEFNITEAIYKAQGKNAIAIRALIDPEKLIDEEIARLQKDEPYLFAKVSDDIPDGTGKKGADNLTAKEKELEAMRRAVGL